MSDENYVSDAPEQTRLAGEIERLEAENARLKEDAAKREEFWNEAHKAATEGLMVLHDRHDIIDGAGLRIGDFVGDAVPWLVQQYDAAYAALRRAYRKSEVLDEPCYVNSVEGFRVTENDPDFDTITKAFERGEKP